MAQIAPESYRLKTGELVVVRSADAEDAAAVLAYVRAVHEDGVGLITLPDEFDMTEETERDWIQQHADDPGKLVLVAETAGKLIGLVDIHCGLRRRLAHRGVLSITVAPGWRGRGVGTILLRRLIDWAEAHPTLEKLALEVLSSNSTAIRLYRSFGFVEEGRDVREVKHGPDQYEDGLRMARFVKDFAD